MPRNSPWTVTQCRDALQRAKEARDTQGIARWTERMREAKAAEKDAPSKRRDGMKKRIVRALTSIFRATGFEVRRAGKSSAKADKAYVETHVQLFAELGRAPKHFGRERAA